MRKRIWVLLLAGVLAAIVLACSAPGWRVVQGSGKVVEESREVSGFTSVQLATLGHLTIESGDRESLRIEAEDNLLPYLETEVRDGVLRIGSRDGVAIRTKRPVRFYLTAKRLEALTISGSGDVEMVDWEAESFSVTITGSGGLQMGDLDAETFDVRVTGSGGMTMGDLHSDALALQLTGSGSVEIGGGEVEEQEITISGSGDYGARGMESGKAQVRTTGSGGATLRVSETLEVKITGSGDVRYVGSPDVEQTVTGSGEVRKVSE